MVLHAVAHAVAHAVGHAVHAVACCATVTQAPGMACSGTAMSQIFVFCMSGDLSCHSVTWAQEWYRVMSTGVQMATCSRCRHRGWLAV